MAPADAALSPPAPGAARAVCRSRPVLTRRLAWLTVASVLVVEALLFLPTLTHARREWLERHLRGGQLAAMAASVGKVDAATGADLLHLANVEAVRLRDPDSGTYLLARPGMVPEAGARLSLNEDPPFSALGGAIGGLFRGGDRLLSVTGPGALPDDRVSVTVLAHRRDLDAYLAGVARRVGLLSLAAAMLAGALLHAALTGLLVRPLRRLTENIAAFRADPERAAPFEPPAGGDDEIAVAGRELAAMQSELRAALWRNTRLAALGTAVAKISHDLRGILSPALLTAERLQMNQDPAIKRAGDTLVRAVERATELVRRTVEFAREIPVAPQRERMALRPALAEAIELARIACPELAVENAVPEELEIDAERSSVIRVFANLLRNAGEAQARRARVAAAEEAGQVAVTVSDDGPGLPEQVQAALFRPFVAGSRPGSTGLGLAIVRDLMRAHGGEASLVETGPGGTSFRLTFPRAVRSAAPREAAPQRPVELRG